MSLLAQEQHTYLSDSQPYSFPPVRTGSLHSEAWVLERSPNSSCLKVAPELFFGLSQQQECEENPRRKQQKLSPHSWLAMTPHTGQAGSRSSCSWKWGHSLIFTISKECNLEFKITQINCLLKQNSALFCLGIYILQIKKSAKKQKLCWCLRLWALCAKRRKITCE